MALAKYREDIIRDLQENLKGRSAAHWEPYRKGLKRTKTAESKSYPVPKPVYTHLKKCPVCYRTYANQEALNSHLKLIHNISDPENIPSNISENAVHNPEPLKLWINHRRIYKTTYELSDPKALVELDNSGPSFLSVTVKVDNFPESKIEIRPGQRKNIADCIGKPIFRKLELMTDYQKFEIVSNLKFETLSLKELKHIKITASDLDDMFCSGMPDEYLLNYIKLIISESDSEMTAEETGLSFIYDYCKTSTVHLSSAVKIETSLYIGLFAQKNIYSLSTALTDELFKALDKLLKGNLNAADELLKSIPKDRYSPLFHQIQALYFYLQGDEARADFQEQKSFAYQPLQSILEALKYLNGDKLPAGLLDTNVLDELELISHYPVISSLLKILAGTEQFDYESKIWDFKELKHLSPFYSLLSLDFTDDSSQLRESIENLTKVFPDSRLISSADRLLRTDNYHSLKKLLRDIRSEYQNDKNNPEFEIVNLSEFSEIGRSCILIKTKFGNIVLDSGFCILDGSPYLPDYMYCNERIDWIVISHAHLDHCGSILELLSISGNSKVIVTPATKIYLQEILRHSIDSLDPDEFEEKIYFDSSMQKILNDLDNRLYSIEFNETIDLNPNLSLTIRKAGHMFGAGMIELNISGSNVVYTGDFSVSEMPLAGKADLKALPKNIHTLIMEGTFLNRAIPDTRSSITEIEKLITQKIENGQSLLIAGSSIGFNQEIITLINRLKKTSQIPEKIRILTAGTTASVIRSLRESDSGYFIKEFSEVSACGYNRIFEQLYKPEPKIIVCSSGNLSPESIAGGLTLEIIENELDYSILHSEYLEEWITDLVYQSGRTEDFKKIFLTTHPIETELKSVSTYLKPKSLAINHTSIKDQTIIKKIFKDQQVRTIQSIRKQKNYEERH